MENWLVVVIMIICMPVLILIGANIGDAMEKKKEARAKKAKQDRQV